MRDWRAPVYAWNTIPRLLGIKNYLNNYLAMYTRLTRSHIRVEIYPPATWGSELFK